MGFAVLPPAYQSQEIPFTEWVSLLTLALAPLVAHLFAGAPRPSLLVPTRPRWHDYMCHFNPAAILYRYAAITERRIRAYEWRPIDVAAANALFWTGHGWDGSEQMVTSSLPYCDFLPESTIIEIVSSDMLKTVVTTMQGMQAIVTLTGLLAGTVFIIDTQPAIDFIFGPLSMLGLLRLFASPWLINDFTYSTRITSTWTRGYEELAAQRRASLDSLLEIPVELKTSENRYRPSSYWPSRLFRALYLLILACFWFIIMTYAFLVPNINTTTSLIEFTATSYSIILFYFVTFTSTLFCYAWYAIRGQTTSTILPCASHRLFKAYTAIWMLLATTLVAISALETFKTVCGVYTSIPAAWATTYTCATTHLSVTTVNPNPSLAGSLKTFGLASQYYNGPQTEADVSLGHGEFWVVNFTGTCLGEYGDFEVWSHTKTLGNVNSTEVWEPELQTSGTNAVQNYGSPL